MKKQERALPKWMKGKRAAVGDALGNIMVESKENASDNSPPKRRLRSNFAIPKTEQELKSLEPKIYIEDLPFISYSGKIHYLTDFHAMAIACDDLIQQVEAREEEGDDIEQRIGVSFDLEWYFSFQTGPDRTAVMQICLDLDNCYIFHLTSIYPKIPASLTAFLNHPRVLLHGVNIKNDFRKLERDYPTIKADPLIEKCKDLGVYYNYIFNSSGRWSMERLVLQVRVCVCVIKFSLILCA